MTPLRLEASFDTEQECSELVAEGFPDMVDEMKLDVTAQLFFGKGSMAGLSRGFVRNLLQSSCLGSHLLAQSLFKKNISG